MNKVRQRTNSLLCRLVQVARVILFRTLSNNTIAGSPRCYQPIQCVGAGRVSVEERVSIGYFPSPHFFSTYAFLEARSSTASISIGSGTWINNNFCAVAEHTAIRIGKNCLIGTNVEILDTDGHGLEVTERSQSRPEWAKPVYIGDNVFVGSNVKILKGVTIGNGSVIANGAVVSSDIPANVVAGGNPAKIIKKIGERG